MNFFSSPIVFGPIKKINAIPEITKKIKRGILSFKITSDSFKRFKNMLSIHSHNIRNRICPHRNVRFLYGYNFWYNYLAFLKVL